MSREIDVVAVSTIGIDTGKNTLHLIGLDRHETIVLREKLARGRIRCRLANVPPYRTTGRSSTVRAAKIAIATHSRRPGRDIASNAKRLLFMPWAVRCSL